MQIFHPTTAFIIMVVLCSLLWQRVMTVIYSHEPVTKTEGLKCTVKYKIQDCDIQTNCRYLITVNETERDEYRLRSIFLTLNSLRRSDSGFYQCDAECLNSGTLARGHLVHLIVTADPYKGLKFSAWSGQLKADKSSQVKSALLSILPHVQHIHTEN
uniref:Zgc:174945 n=1 Tax=Sinocyclocheilus rhinocerous TaxID=307959 RepID=A0A673GGU7_9TELE